MKEVKENGGRSEKIWRYVHQEMEEQERQEFERMMDADEALRREMDPIRQLHGSLHKLMPLTEQTEETLADQILRDWEQSTAHFPANPRKNGWTHYVEGVRNIIEGWQWSPYALRSLATVAATVLLVVGIRAYLAGPVEWIRPEIGLGIQYRGDGQPGRTPAYTRDEFLELHRALRQSVDQHLANVEGTEQTRSWLGGGRKWRLAAKYQELPNGGTQVQVTLYSSRDGRWMKEWSNYYPDLHSFENEVDELGKQIVKELMATQSGTY